MKLIYDPKNTVYDTEIEEDKGILDIYKEFLFMEKGEEFEFEETIRISIESNL